MSETRKDRVKAATKHYSSGYDHWRTVWDNVQSPAGHNYSPNLVKDDLVELSREDPTFIRQVITATGSSKTFYARSGN